MIRNLKALGLALVAVFSMGAVVASAASAQQAYFTSDGPVTLDGTEIAGATTAFTQYGLRLECPGSTFAGHRYKLTPHEPIPHEDANGQAPTTFTLSPEFNQQKCNEASLNLPTTIVMNECDFVVHLGETTGGANTYGVNYDIVCPPGKEITTTSWFSAAEHNEGKESCVIHIPPQSGRKGGHVTDETNGHFKLDGTVEGIESVKTKDKLHPLLCPAVSNAEGKLDLNVTVGGTNKFEGLTEVGISEQGETTSTP